MIVGLGAVKSHCSKSVRGGAPLGDFRSTFKDNPRYTLHVDVSHRRGERISEKVEIINSQWFVCNAFVLVSIRDISEGNLHGSDGNLMIAWRCHRME